MRQDLLTTTNRLWRASLVACLAFSAGGCGISTLTSGLGGGIFGSGSSPQTASQTKVSEEQLLSAAKLNVSDTGGDIAGGCPRFTVWPRDEAVTIYEPGRVGDALYVMHRGEIMKTARECSVENGRVTVKYGFSGRVLMGPKGKTGTVFLPVNVFVTDAKREKLNADKMKVDTQVTLDRPIGYFSLVNTLSFPVPEGARPGEFELFVGFERNIPNAG